MHLSVAQVPARGRAANLGAASPASAGGAACHTAAARLLAHCSGLQGGRGGGLLRWQPGLIRDKGAAEGQGSGRRCLLDPRHPLSLRGIPAIAGQGRGRELRGALAELRGTLLCLVQGHLLPQGPHARAVPQHTEQVMAEDGPPILNPGRKKGRAGGRPHGWEGDPSLPQGPLLPCNQVAHLAAPSFGAMAVRVSPAAASRQGWSPTR